jgi:5-methylcytosine-specific restriction endonuclease McrA
MPIKLGMKLSKEHKESIAKSVKMRWERGDFDSDRIRNIWRKAALSNIAKKGKPSPNKLIPSQDMLDDLSKMGDKDFSSKWGVSIAMPVKLRKRYNIKSFNNKHGTVEHKFEDGQEYKWCQKGHWELIVNFGKHSSRWDGLRGHCKLHSNESRVKSYDNTNGAEKARKWLQTEKGKSSKRATMRKVWAKRRGNYIKFDLVDEEKIYELCNKSCAYCKTPITFDGLEFDHFIPINSGGMTEPKNMLPACVSCNRGRGGKFDKDPYQWLMTKFGAYIGEQIYQNCVTILESIGE